MYIRFSKVVGSAVNAKLYSPEAVDKYFVKVAHPTYGICFKLDWNKEMLEGGIYYTRLFT